MSLTASLETITFPLEATATPNGPKLKPSSAPGFNVAKVVKVKPSAIPAGVSVSVPAANGYVAKNSVASAATLLKRAHDLRAWPINSICIDFLLEAGSAGAPLRPLTAGGPLPTSWEGCPCVAAMRADGGGLKKNMAQSKGKK